MSTESSRPPTAPAAKAGPERALAREVRILKIYAVVSTLVLAGLLGMAWRLHARPQFQSLTVGHLAVDRLDLVGGDGATRARLGLDRDGEPRLELLGHDGRVTTQCP